MRKNVLAALVANEAPSATTLTEYDEEHLPTYRGLLAAQGDGAEWDEAALLVLRIDPIREPTRAQRAWESHLTRANWLLDHGYLHLFSGSAAY